MRLALVILGSLAILLGLVQQDKGGLIIGGICLFLAWLDTKVQYTE